MRLRSALLTLALVPACFNPDDGDDSGADGDGTTTGSGSTEATTPGSTMTENTTSTTPGSTSLDATSLSDGSETADDAPTTDGPTDDTVGDDTTTGVVEMCGDGLFVADNPPFGDPVQIAMLLNTQGVAVADVDDDGANDIVLGDFGDADPTAGGVWLMLGHGDGTFDAPALLPGGGVPAIRVAAAPIADNSVDVVAMIAEPPNFQIAVRRWRGNGDGTFLAPADYAGATDWDVALGDVNGDGRRDLIGNAPDGFDLSLANASEAFGAATTVPGASSANAVKVGDADGDGDVDVLSAGMDQIQLWINDGTGAFGPAMGLPVADGGYVADVAIADFDADGNADLLGAGGSILSARFGAGNGVFADEAQHTVQGSVLAAAVPDFDVDGCADVVVGNNTGTVSLVMSLGEGQFADQVIYNIGPDDYFYDLDAGDLDGDQIADIVGVTAGASADEGGRVWALFSGA